MRSRDLFPSALDCALAGAVGAFLGMVAAFVGAAFNRAQDAAVRPALVIPEPVRYTATPEAEETAQAPAMRTPIDLLIDEDFLAALAAVESGGDDSAVNLSSGATGRYQITAPCLIDANRILGTDFALVEMHDPAKARRVVRAYLGHYGARLKHPTRVALARIWNGGPRGHLRDATRGYADRFHRVWLEVRTHA